MFLLTVISVGVVSMQTKFRDEIRPRFGLIRCCEFVMKDAYSFDRDEEGLAKNYTAMHTAYQKIFKRCGLKLLTVEADPGVMGGKVSHEFMVPAREGEDIVLTCAKCQKTRAFREETPDCACPDCNVPMEKVNTIEVSHIFKWVTKYSAQLGRIL